MFLLLILSFCCVFSNFFLLFLVSFIYLYVGTFRWGLMHASSSSSSSSPLVLKVLLLWLGLCSCEQMFVVFRSFVAGWAWYRDRVDGGAADGVPVVVGALKLRWPRCLCLCVCNFFVCSNVNSKRKFVLLRLVSYVNAIQESSIFACIRNDDQKAEKSHLEWEYEDTFLPLGLNKNH